MGDPPDTPAGNATVGNPTAGNPTVGNTAGLTLAEILTLAPHDSDVMVGTGPKYPWGALYGGQIVAQALVAAGRTVSDEMAVHSLRAYFIRRGEQVEPVRYEVDRLRNGRSFCTRRVVALQNGTVILNLEASFQVHEESADIDTVSLDPTLGPPDKRTNTSWSPHFEKSFNESAVTTDRIGTGRATAWMRAVGDLGDDPLVHAAALTFMSDDLPTDSVIRAHPMGSQPHEVLERIMFSASLDHTIWFHRPAPAGEWMMHDFECHNFAGARGLGFGHLHALDGTHVATVAQEILLRDMSQKA
jgi:acyl-CoA thioesterase-2